VTNLAVLDFRGPGNAMRLRSVHPGVTVEQVQEQTGFELALAAPVGRTPAPTSEQLRIIRTVLDPHDLRAAVFES
jgi:glutaconate CoA-transferase subunit B